MSNERKKKRPNKKMFRIHFWVEPRLQIPYLLTIIIFSFLACVGVGGLFYLFLTHTNGVFVMAIARILPDFPVLGQRYLEMFAQLLIQEKMYITWTYITVFSVIMIGCIIAGVFLSHRYAGPIIAFRRSIRGIIKGEPLRPIKLRKGDEMRDLMDAFNLSLEHIQHEQDAETKSLKACHDLAAEKLKSPSFSDGDRRQLKEIQDITTSYAA